MYVSSKLQVINSKYCICLEETGCEGLGRIHRTHDGCKWLILMHTVMQGIPLLVEDLLVCQEGLCSMELVMLFVLLYILLVIAVIIS
jgi:hypothetical protein